LPLAAAARGLRARPAASAIAAAAVVLLALFGVWRWRASGAGAGGSAGDPDRTARAAQAGDGAASAAGASAVSASASTSSTIATRTLSRLTQGPGLQTDATWSPDGRFIAYASDRAGNFDVWVQPVAGGDPVQVTRSDAQDTQPEWSPDGTRIVFRSERDGGGLFIVPVLGGAEQRLTSSGQDPRWSPDGRQLLFFAGQLGPGVTDSGLQVMGMDGEPPRDVWQDFTLVFAAGWHPDGRVSALGVHRTLGPGFFTGRVDGQDLVRSAMSADIRRNIGLFEQYLVRFRWDSRGQALFFEVNTNGVQNLWKMRVDPATLGLLSAEALTVGANRATRAALSPDGTRLAYTSLDEAVRLWSLPFNAAAARVTGAPAAFTEDGARVSTSDLSADGRRAAYTLSRLGSTRDEFWITEVATGKGRMLVADEWRRENPRWSPDGSAVAYTRVYLDATQARQQLIVNDLAGHEQVLLDDRTPQFHLMFAPFDWTRDGRQLLAMMRPAESAGGGLVLWPARVPSTSTSPSGTSTSATLSSPSPSQSASSSSASASRPPTSPATGSGTGEAPSLSAPSLAFPGPPRTPIASRTRPSAGLPMAVSSSAQSSSAPSPSPVSQPPLPPPPGAAATATARARMEPASSVIAPATATATATAATAANAAAGAGAGAGGQRTSPFASSRVLVADARYNLWQGRLSPDGRWLAFVFIPLTGQGYPSVAIVPADPRAADDRAGAAAASGVPAHWRRVAPELLFVDKPRWSPDGRLLYFLARGAGSRFNVWAIRVAPATGMPVGQPIQVTKFDRPDLIISPDVDQAEMSLSADRLVLTMKQMSGSVWILDGVGGPAVR
jgi:Tol biopolymer transport system component